MTRIAHLLSHYPHPSHSFLRDEVIGLRDAGLEVETIALNPAADAHILTELDRAERVRTRYVKAHPVRVALVAIAEVGRRHPIVLIRFVLRAASEGRPDPSTMLRRAAQAIEAVIVHRWCRQLEVDHLHAHFGGAPGTVARLAASLSHQIDPGRPLSWSITIHGPHDFMNERNADLATLVNSADLVVAISEFTAAQLLRLATPHRRSRVKVVRCGIDLELFTRHARPIEQRSDGESRSGAEALPLRLVTLGRLAPEKGQWVLVEAVAQLVDRGVDVTLHLIGDGELRAELRRQVDELGLSERIEFIRVLSPGDVRAAVAQADVFCLPSFAEGLPIALMEAAAVGTPIVCTSVAGIPELVLDGRTGRCVPAGSPSELAAAIEELARDPALRRSLADGARARVELRHDRRSTTRQLAAELRAAVTAAAAGQRAA